MSFEIPNHEAGHKSFSDADGNASGTKAFEEAVEGGQHFAMNLIHAPGKPGTLTLKLLPAGTDKGVDLGLRRLPTPKLPVGKPLPEFHLPLATGGMASPASLRGAPTPVDFLFAVGNSAKVEKSQLKWLIGWVKKGLATTGK